MHKVKRVFVLSGDESLISPFEKCVASSLRLICADSYLFLLLFPEYSANLSITQHKIGT